MDKRLKVLLHGDTLVLAGVHAGLAVYPTLDVMLSPGCDLALPTLHELAPDVVILERAAMTPTALATLAEELTNVLLLSIDAEQGRILMWSDRRIRQLSMTDFVRLIVNYAVVDLEVGAPAPMTDVSAAGGASR